MTKLETFNSVETICPECEDLSWAVYREQPPKVFNCRKCKYSKSLGFLESTGYAKIVLSKFNKETK